MHRSGSFDDDSITGGSDNEKKDSLSEVLTHAAVAVAEGRPELGALLRQEAEATSGRMSVSGEWRPGFFSWAWLTIVSRSVWLAGDCLGSAPGREIRRRWRDEHHARESQRYPTRGVLWVRIDGPMAIEVLCPRGFFVSRWVLLFLHSNDWSCILYWLNVCAFLIDTLHEKSIPANQ